MNTLELNIDSVNFALTKLKTFVQVTKDRPEEDKEAALEYFCESVGINESVMNHLYSDYQGFFSENAGLVFVGTLIGLALAEHSMDKNG